MFAWSHLQEVERMSGYVHIYLHLLVGEIGYNKQQFLPVLAKECKLTIADVLIHVHQVERFTQTDSLFSLFQKQHFLVLQHEGFLLSGEFSTVEIAVIDAFQIPVVEDGGTTVAPAETFVGHSTFTKLLSSIEHERILGK